MQVYGLSNPSQTGLWVVSYFRKVAKLHVKRKTLAYIPHGYISSRSNSGIRVINIPMASTHPTWGQRVKFYRHGHYLYHCVNFYILSSFILYTCELINVRSERLLVWPVRTILGPKQRVRIVMHVVLPVLITWTEHCKHDLECGPLHWHVSVHICVHFYIV